MAVACSRDDEADRAPLPEEGTAKVVFSLSTRASGTPEDAAGANELINSWWVAFVDANDKVAAFASNTLTKAAEYDDFELELPIGTYTIVAFANKVPEKISANSYKIAWGDKSLTFTLKETSPVLFGDQTLWPVESPEEWGSDALVPMTGLMKVRVTGRVTEPFSIEVVRQVAKFEISFENVAKRDVTVHGFWIEEGKADAVTLFPNYDCLGSLPKLPATYGLKNAERKLGGLRIAPDDSATDIFFTREAIAKEQPNGVFTLYVDVTHHAGQGVEAKRDTVSELIRDLSYINRNDHIKLPVRLTDYVITVDALFYPPIGGYPAIMLGDNVGNYWVRFGSIGDFVITPHIRKAEAGSAELQPGEMTCELSYDNLNGVEIFSVPPTADPTTGEIIGTMGTNKGAAKIYLTCTIPQDGDNPDLRFTRTILIIRD